jgi:hypothetical protein
MLATGRGSARMESSSRARDGARFEAWLEARIANVDAHIYLNLKSRLSGTILKSLHNYSTDFHSQKPLESNLGLYRYGSNTFIQSLMPLNESCRMLWRDNAFRCGSPQIRIQAIWMVSSASTVIFHMISSRFRIFRTWNVVIKKQYIDINSILDVKFLLKLSEM